MSTKKIKSLPLLLEQLVEALYSLTEEIEATRIQVKEELEWLKKEGVRMRMGAKKTHS